ncbi:uncharacterized protein IL334_001205 [Kwoniella shivajii]|uniref:Glyoxylate reductase n=1 Tax=Kwoniella shivajii TaxID=564305 RepID=A0ABZ1CSD4_9TREE|nr:hypothetical protein IL334_001205 [Kwoniella shivajii]
MSKILVTRHVGEHAMRILENSGYELIINPEDSEPSREWVLKQLADPAVKAACIMHSQPSDKVDEELIDICNQNLKCISTFSVGYGERDMKRPNSTVADITVMLVLMTLRKVGYGIDLVRRGDVSERLLARANVSQWPQLPWAPFVLCGHSIGHPGLTIGFLGFGRIPQAVVDRLLAFTNKDQPARILYTSSRARDNQDEIDAGFSKRYGVQVKRVEKDELAREADVLIVLCNLNPSTKDLGPVVNSEDLYNALKSRQIWGAGLDVLTGEPNIKPDHPLLHLDNCSADYDTRDKMAELCVRNAIAGATGKALLAEVEE